MANFGDETRAYWPSMAEARYVLSHPVDGGPPLWRLHEVEHAPAATYRLHLLFECRLSERTAAAVRRAFAPHLAGDILDDLVNGFVGTDALDD